MKPNNLHTENAALGCGNEKTTLNIGTTYSKLLTLAMILLNILGYSYNSNATTYTYTSGGNQKWSANNWNQTPPTTFSNGDIININGTCKIDVNVTIPNGVTLNDFSGAGGITIIAGQTLTIASGGTYVHAQDGGIIPIASWDPASNCNITGVYPTSGMGQTFGNVNFTPTSSSTTITMTSNLACSDLTISQGTLNANNVNITVGGNWINNGTFSGGTGTVTFTGSGKTISGTNSIPNVTINGTYTNNGTLTVSTALSGTGSLTQGSNANLNIGGTSGITTLTATASGNTVNYNGNAQTIKAITYNNLTLSGSGDKTMTGVTATGTITVSGTAIPSILPASISKLVIDNTNGVSLPNDVTISNNLTFTNGKLLLAAGKVLTIPASATITGYGTSNYIVTDNIGSRLDRNGMVPGTEYLFPVGTASGYLPMFLTPGGSTNADYKVRAFNNITTNGAENGGSTMVDNNAVQATWIADNVAGSISNVKFGWVSGLQGTGFATLLDASIGISRYSSTISPTGWDNATGTATKSSFTVNRTFTTALTGSAAFGIGRAGVPLPIVLKFFTGAPVKNTAQLNWETANDDAREFILEKSTNGKDFSTVTTIASNLTRQYAYTDPIQAGINYYYRLKMQELDGTYTYSNIVNIKTDKMSDPVVSVYPNPATNWLELNHSLLTTAAKAEITDLQGRVIISQDIESNAAHTKINISNLPQGYFMVRIKGDALNFSQAFIHQ